MHRSAVSRNLHVRHKKPMTNRVISRFAEVEAIAVISLVLKRYKITVDETRFPTIPGETIVARRERLFGTTQELLLTPTNTPLVFTRR